MPQFAAAVAGVSEGKGGMEHAVAIKICNEHSRQADLKWMRLSAEVINFSLSNSLLQIVLLKEANVEIDENGISNFQ